MAENLMDSYNPLYDVHLRQYFASPHMQKHLRNLGLLQGDDSEDYCDENQLYARHHMMMDMMLRNRETQLAKLADIQKKLDAAEKIEICRKIRSGITSPETFRRAKPSRSLSRSRFSALNRKRRSSTSTDDKDLIKKIESDTAEPQDGDPNYVYNRLSASAGKFRYMHKLDDETLSAYMEQLRRQLDKLERFREVSFGPNSVAKHQTEPHLSWFFRRRSLPSLSDSEQANPLHEPLRSVQSLKHRSRLGKSSSPRKLDESDNSADSYPRKMMRPSSIESRRLPPITRNDNSGQSSTASSTAQNLPARARTVHQKRRSKSRKSDEPVRMTKAKPKEDTVSKLALIGVPALAGGVTAAASVGLATAANSETPNPVMPSPPKSIEEPQQSAEDMGSADIDGFRGNESTEQTAKEATLLSVTPPATEITEKYEDKPNENQQQCVSNNEEQLDAVEENPPSDEINDRNLSESLNKTEFDQPQTASIESRPEEVFRGDESTEVTPGEEALLSVTPPVTKIIEKYEDEPVSINEEQSDAVEGNLPPDVSTDHNLIESPNKVEFDESHAVTIESRSQEALRDNVSTEIKSEEATLLSMTPPETQITEKYKGEPDENQQQYVSISEEQFDASEGNPPSDEINDHDLSESPNKVEFDQLQTAGTESRAQEAFRSNELTEETSKEASGTPPLTEITEKYEDEPNENQQQYVSINEEQSDAVQENPPPDVSTDHNLIESPNKIDSDQPQGVSTETHFQEISSENGENKRSAEDEGEVLIEEEAAIAETSKDDHLDEEIPKYETALQLEAPAPSDLQGSLESPIVEGQTLEEAAKFVELSEPDTESIVRHSVSSLENQNEKQLELLSTENTASEEVMQPSSDRLSDKATASEQDEMTKKTLQDDSIIESLEQQDQPTELIQSQSEEIMKHEVVPVQSAALDSTLFEESVENDRTADDHMMGSRAEQSVSGRQQAEPDVVEATMQQVESSKPSEITDARITDAVSVQNSDHKEIERKLMNEFENGEDHIPGEDNESVVDVKTIESQQLVSPALSTVHESDGYDEANQKEKRRSEDDKSTLIFPPDVLLILKRTNDIAEEEAFVNPTRVQQITANPESSKMETGPDGTSSIVDGKDDTVSLDNINQESGHNLNDVDMGKFDDSSSVVNVDSNGISIATQGILNDDSSGVTEKLVVDNIDIVNASESPKLTESESTEERFADGSRRVDEVAHSREADTLNVAPFVAEESPIDGERLNESILELPPTVEGAVSQSENPPEVLQESQTGQFLSSNAFIEMEQHSMKEQRTEDEVSYLENNNQEQKSVSADDANDLIGDIVLQNKQPTAELHETSLEDHKSSPISEALIDHTNEPTQTLQIGDESPTLIGKPSEECEKVGECNERESNIDDATVLHTKHVQSTTANIPSEYIKYESDRTVEKSDVNHLDQLKKDQPEDCGSIITVPSEEIINLRPENAINDEGVDEVAEDAKVCKQSYSGDAFNVSLEGAAENLKNFIDENANIPSTANDEHDTMSNSPSGALPDRSDGNEMKSEEQATLLNLSGSVAATTTDEHFRCGEEEEMNTETTPLLDHSKEAARHVLI